MFVWLQDYLRVDVAIGVRGGREREGMREV